MPICDRWAYFDHAAVAPISRPARRAIEQWSQQSVEEGTVVWPQWEARIEEVRRVAAAMVNARPAEIALVPNTTAGINLVANGLDWREGDNMVTLANEFPSNLYPWMNLAKRGVETRRVEMPDGVVDINRIVDACDDRTRIVSVSWVGYATGYRVDVRETAAAVHERGPLFFLDAIQGLGVFPLDVADAQVDFLAADGHKWMLGPEGAGVAYIRQDCLKELRSCSVGWNSVSGRYDFNDIQLQLREEAAHFEGGSQNMVGYHGFGASLELLAACGLGHRRSDIAERILEFSNKACQRIEDVGGRLRFPRIEGNDSGIVTFEMPGHDPTAIRKACLRAGVCVSCRGGGVRISSHAYNNEQDIQRLVEVLQAL